MGPCCVCVCVCVRASVRVCVCVSVCVVCVGVGVLVAAIMLQPSVSSTIELAHNIVAANCKKRACKNGLGFGVQPLYSNGSNAIVLILRCGAVCINPPRGIDTLADRLWGCMRVHGSNTRRKCDYAGARLSDARTPAPRNAPPTAPDISHSDFKKCVNILKKSGLISRPFFGLEIGVQPLYSDGSNAIVLILSCCDVVITLPRGIDTLAVRMRGAMAPRHLVRKAARDARPPRGKYLPRRTRE
jgi:hypothetical protein